VSSLRAGFALPLVILFLLVLGFFGHGILLLSRRDLQATWALRHLVRATQAAEMGLRAAVETAGVPPWDGSIWTAAPVLAGETPDGLGYSVVRRWLGPEFFLLESTGTSRGWEGVRTLGWVGWLQHPGFRLRVFLSPASGSGNPRGEGDHEGAPDRTVWESPTTGKMYPDPERCGPDVHDSDSRR
jgi:hypothetical protein